MVPAQVNRDRPAVARPDRRGSRCTDPSPADGRRLRASVERFAARHRLHDRTSVLLGVFSSVLPSSILERTSKAAFDAAFFGAESRELAGVVVEELADLENVAPAALREEWSRASPDAHSYLLLQAGHVRLASARNLNFGTVVPRPEGS